MKIGIVTDEISLKVDEALGYCNKWGINLVEIRCLETGRVPYINDDELKRFIELKNNYGITVTALSPGFFKGKLSEKEKYAFFALLDSLIAKKKLKDNLSNLVTG